MIPLPPIRLMRLVHPFRHRRRLGVVAGVVALIVAVLAVSVVVPALPSRTATSSIERAGKGTFYLFDCLTDLAADYKALAEYRPTNKVRFVTAASLFDGHDAAINIMRRILQNMGAEVIHLGHNRSVDEVVTAALQEDAQGIAISSYQGGHVEYFKYMIDLLKERGGAHIKVYGGGGGGEEGEVDFADGVFEVEGDAGEGAGGEVDELE